MALDFETTGLSAETHQIIEVGAMRYGDTSLLRHEPWPRPEILSYLIKPLPGTRISARITELTGLNRAQLLRSGVDHEQAIRALVQFCDGCTVVAHNASFDRAFFDAALSRYGLKCHVEWHCTLELSRQAFPHLLHHRLSDVAGLLQMVDDGDLAHRALPDAMKAFAIYAVAGEIVHNAARSVAQR